MKIIEKVLVAKRLSDNKFLRLHESRNTTDFDFVDDPCLAKRIRPTRVSEVGHSMELDEVSLYSPKEASYYFENSYRARELWTKGCVMVPFEITTEVSATELPRLGYPLCQK